MKPQRIRRTQRGTLQDRFRVSQCTKWTPTLDRSLFEPVKISVCGEVRSIQLSINVCDYFSISSGCTVVITSSKCSMEMARPMWPLLPWTVVAFSKEFRMASSTDSIAA